MSIAWQLYYGGLVLIFGSIFVVNIYEINNPGNSDHTQKTNTFHDGLTPHGFAGFLIFLGLLKIMKASILVWMCHRISLITALF